MPRSLKLSRTPIVDMILFINISYFFRVKSYLHDDISSSTLLGYYRRKSCVVVCKGKIS